MPNPSTEVEMSLSWDFALKCCIRHPIFAIFEQLFQEEPSVGCITSPNIT